MLFEHPDCIALELGKLSDYQEPLLPAEADLAFGATRARLWELRAGRTAGRKALSKLSFPVAAILCGAAGEPLWPTELCGSISHTPTHIAVLVAMKSRWRAVGIDLNDGRPLGEQLEARVMSEPERELLAPIAAQLGMDSANIAFSAKEAFFKSQHTITGSRDVTFGDISLQPSPGLCGLRAGLASGLSGHLRFGRLDNQTVCCCLVPAT